MQFLITASEDQLGNMVHAMQGAGINFNPENDLINLDNGYDNGEFHCQPVHHGSELNELVSGANRYLAECGITPLLPDPAPLDMVQRNSLLDLLNAQFTWRATDRVAHPWWEDQGEQKWQELLAEKPEIFAEPSHRMTTDEDPVVHEKLLGPSATAVLGSAMSTLQRRTTGDWQSPGSYCDDADTLLAEDADIRGAVSRTMETWEMPQPLVNIIWEETDLAADEFLNTLSEQQTARIIEAISSQVATSE